MARMQIPKYMFEGVGAMANIVDAIEAKMLNEFSRKLDAQGITSRGVKVPAVAIEGLGSLGRFKLGQNLKNIARKISGKASLKSGKAAKVAVAAEKQELDAMKKLANAPQRTTSAAEKQVLSATVRAAQQIKKQAMKEAAAPTLTKQEIIEAARPQIRAAAIAAANGAQKGIASAMGRRRGGLMPGRNIRAKNNEIVQRQVEMGPLLPFNAIPASSYESETDVSGFGDVGADVNTGGDAFGADVSQGADAFGADVSAGADAFGADVSSGADAFGADVSQGADAFGYLGAEDIAPVVLDQNAPAVPSPYSITAAPSAAEVASTPRPVVLSAGPGTVMSRLGGGSSIGKIATIGALIVGGALVAKKLLKKG